jgi:CBS domain-containing protein
MAIVFGFLGLFGNPLLLFIALFVWMGAAEEASMVQMKSALGGIPISRAMITDFRILSPQDPLEKAVAYILGGFQQDFPVIHGERLVGVLTRNALITALAQKGAHGPVEEVMERRFETADPSEMLETVFERFRNCQCRTLPIIRGEELIGMVTLENLGEFMMVHSALRRVKA